MRTRPIFLFLALAGLGFAAREQKAGFADLRLSFEANRGQTDPTVKFLARGDGYTLFLTADSAVFRLGSAFVRMKLDGANPSARVSGADTLPGKVNYFIGSDPTKWTSGASTFGSVNYNQVYKDIDLVYHGANSDAQHQLEYDFVVAPGADAGQIALEFAGAQARLGADGSLLLTVDGAPLKFRKPMVYQTAEGKSARGEKEPIAGAYQLTGNRVQFKLGKYDHTRALVIDPVLSYLTYLGGSKTDVAGFTTYGGNPTQGMAADSTGNVYVTGSTQSTDFPIVQGAIQATNTTNANTGFVLKLNSTGSQLIYSTYLGGGVLNDNSITRAYAIAVDSSGNAYVTGFTSSQKFPVTGGAYQTLCGSLFNNVSNCPGVQSAFLTKLSPTGGLVYSTFLGHNNETAVAVAVDSQGRAYVAGNTGDQCVSTNTVNCFPTTANAVTPGSVFNTTLNPNNFNQGSAFISVFDAAEATLLYSSVYGGNGAATGNEHATFASGVAVDSAGNFYLAGTTGSNQLPVTPGAFQTTFYGNPNPGFGASSRGFVAKFNPVSSGATLAYATYLGGFDKTAVSYQDVVSGIAADASGNAYISGYASYDFPATAGANNSTPCPSSNSCENRGFLAKLNPAGNALTWATFVGTVSDPTLSSADTISAPRLDGKGNVYVSGIAGNNTEYPLVNPLQPANGYGGVYVTVYDPTGSTISFSTVIYDPTDNGGQFSSGVDVDAQGNIYVAGYSNTGGLPVTAGALQPASAGPSDLFLAKINTSLPSPTITPGGIVPLDSTVSTIQPGEWISIFGTNLGAISNWTGNFPTTLGGTSVTIDGRSAYLYYVSPTQINLQVPDDSSTGSVPVVVKTSGGTAFANVTLAAFAPSFSLLDATHVAAIIIRTDGSGAYGGGSYDILGPTGSSLGYKTVAAKAGDTLELFGVGFGPTSPTVAAGAAYSGAASTTNPVTLSINSVSVPPFFAGITSAGLYQFNVTIPAGLGPGDVSLQGSVGGAKTPVVAISLQ